MCMKISYLLYSNKINSCDISELYPDILKLKKVTQLEPNNGIFEKQFIYTTNTPWDIVKLIHIVKCNIYITDGKRPCIDGNEYSVISINDNKPKRKEAKVIYL